MESASQLTWKLKAANGLRILKGKLGPQGEESVINPYVRLYFLGVCVGEYLLFYQTNLLEN